MSITINFTGAINNDSLQIGDAVYFVSPSASINQHFNHSIETPEFGGIVETIVNNGVITPGSCSIDAFSKSTTLQYLIKLHKTFLGKTLS